MKRIVKLFLINMVIVFPLLCTIAGTERDHLAKTEPVYEHAGFFIAGLGLVGLSALMRKRSVK